jgi:hypothetical protein
MIYSYGEDSLTLWALTEGLRKLLCSLGETAVKPDVVFYRPSLGRGSGIGEFDFIIKTKQKTYFGESKWPLSSKRKDKNCCRITLGAKQIKRHAEVNGFLAKKSFKKTILEENKIFIKDVLGEILQENVLLVFASKKVKKITVDTEIVRNNTVELEGVLFKVVHIPTEDIPFAKNSGFIEWK